jgi:methyl-accepting chemotaxis protein
VAGEVNDISGAAGEQRSASETIARNIEDIARMIEDSVRVVQHNAQSAEELTQVARAMRAEVAWFRT